MLAKRTKYNRASVMNTCSSWRRLRGFRFRQTDARLHSFITISCMGNNLNVFFFIYITRSLSTGFYLRLYSQPLLSYKSWRNFNLKNLICNFCSHMLIKLGWFSFIINSFVTSWDYLYYFFSIHLNAIQFYQCQDCHSKLNFKK